MVSDMDPNSSAMDIETIAVDTNTATNDFQHDPPNSTVNGVGDRVNVVQQTNDVKNAKDDAADLMKDIAAKTAQLAAMQRRQEESEKKFTG